MIVNSSQNLSNFDSSNVKGNSGQKKRKLIINSNESLEKITKKARVNFIKKAREDGITKNIINC